MNRKSIWALSVLLTLVLAATAVASSRDEGVPPGSMNGAKNCIRKDGSIKPGCVGHRQFKNGSVSCQKLVPDLQKRLCGGIIGIPGNKGDTGASGAKGDTGAAGELGKPGAAGSPGTPGATGTPGPAGHDASNPLIFGPYNSGSSDSSICGNDWADDTYTRTYIVAPQTDGSFTVTELYNGTFVTLAGNSPGDADCATTAGDVAAGITGSFYGDYAVLVPPGGDFNQNAVCPAGCTTSQFFVSVFGKPANFLDSATYGWEFFYHTAAHGDWANTDHGNTGNIS